MLAASLLTFALTALLFLVYTPFIPLHSLRLGGLLERALLIEIKAWYVALGWRLFASGGSPQPEGSPQGYKCELGQPRM